MTGDSQPAAHFALVDAPTAVLAALITGGLLVSTAVMIAGRRTLIVKARTRRHLRARYASISLDRVARPTSAV
jgi:hypothetical protein